jgi:hypothetical protein
MMKNYMLPIVVVLSLFFLACSSVTSKQNEADRRAPREKMKVVRIEAEVKEIDYKERMVTLEGPLGNLVTLKASDQVKRLNEIKKGDIVAADYWTYLFSEFRNPTPEEEKNPLMIYTDADVAPAEKPPGAAAGIVVRAVVTVEVINKEDKLVTIKGPKGKYLTLPVEDMSLLTDLEIGEVIILTYAEAVALSIEKVK